MKVGQFLLFGGGVCPSRDAKRHAVECDDAGDLALQAIVAKECPHGGNDIAVVLVGGDLLGGRQIQFQNAMVGQMPALA